MFGRSTAYLYRKNGYVELHQFMNKKLQQNFFKPVGIYGFCRDTAPQKLAFVNLNCIMAGFGWLLHYMLSKTSLNFEG